MFRSKEKNKAFLFFALYTVIFAFACFVVFCWYFLKGRTFIYQSDGWNQHYKALVYYAEYLRSILRELVEHHRFVLPEWEFALGEGNDILQSLHYYVIGDPFAVFSFLVPTRFMWVYYDFMILLRLYLAGVAFSCLCFSTQERIGGYAVIAGALSYVFCTWGIFNANRHPYFLNPMIYFPLIILGIEKILKKEKPYIFIVSVFLAAISNFYYFYNIVLLTVVYVIVRLFTKYKTDLKSMRSVFIRICGGSVLGAAMGGVVLLPVIYAFLNDARMASPITWYLSYSPTYYVELIWVFFYGNGNYWRSYWLSMGYAAPVILAIFLLFMRKGQYRLLKVCFLVCIVIISVPALGQLLNGMSYRSNKWCWAFALLCAYIFSIMWSELMDLNVKEARRLAVFLGILLVLDICYLGLMRSAYSKALAVAACIGVAFAFLLVGYPFRLEMLQKSLLWKRWRQAVALGLVIVGIGLVSTFENAPFAIDYAQKAIYAKNVANLMQTEVNAVQEAAAMDDTTNFYRYSGRKLTQNAGMLYHISNTNYYWSISNPAVSSFRLTMGLPEYRTYNYQGYDDRTALLTLGSIKYFVTPNNNKAPIPYGFTYIENLTSGYKVYRNEYALPISYCYDFVISEDRWNSFSAVEKQEAMLQSVFLAGYDGKTQDDAVEHNSRSLDYSLECNSDTVTLEDSSFVVTAPNASITLHFEGLADSETYFTINGLTVSKGATLTVTSSSGVSKAIEYYTESYNWFNDRHDFTVNLDYTEEAVTAITVTFSDVGVYSFDSIEVACQPMDGYAEQATALKNTGLENVVIGTDTVCGTISLEKLHVLCFSIPYSAGWTAYVDGEETVLYQANIKNMAVPLDAGTHDVRLVYRTPYLRMGACLSLLGLIGLFALIWNDNKKRKIPS